MKEMREFYRELNEEVAEIINKLVEEAEEPEEKKEDIKGKIKGLYNKFIMRVTSVKNIKQNNTCKTSLWNVCNSLNFLNKNIK